MEPSITSLPPDIQRLLAQYSSSLLYNVPRLSRVGGTPALQEEFIRRVCNSSLNQKEVNNYLKNISNSYAIFYHSTSPIGRTYVGLYYNSNKRNEHLILNIGPYVALIDTKIKNNINFRYPTPVDWNRDPKATLDLDSTYRIYERRVSCLRYNPNLPKIKINNIINDLTDALESDDIYRVGSAIIYIALNSIVLGVPNYIPEIQRDPITLENIGELRDAAFDQLEEIRRLYK